MLPSGLTWTGTASASANTSKKRKTPSDSDDVPAKRARTTPPATNGTVKKTAAAAKPKAKAATTTTKTTKAAPAKAATTKKATTAKPAAATKKETVAKPAAAPKKAAAAKPATKAAPKKKTPEPKTNGVSRKRASPVSEAEDVSDEEEEKPKVVAKKAKAAPAPKKPKVEKVVTSPKPKERKKGAVINDRPTELLNVFVFGENSSGELGLGDRGNVIDVKRPRLNPFLKDKKVVAIAAGGMHQAFLTADGKILTCGVNDQGSLGRDTAGAEKLKDVDGASDSEDDENGLNTLEAAPMEVDLTNIPHGTVFTSIAAGDSTTFAVTDDGLVYGCGTFRVSPWQIHNAFTS